VTIVKECPMCGAVNVVENVDFDHFAAWRSGKRIQNALPELTPSQREMLLTGTCETCWDKMWKESDE
jgi:hypothetical protein